MKKNILIIILILITSAFMFYAYLKANQAEQSRELSETARNEALMEKERADALADLAMARAAEATKNQAEAEQQRMLLEECQSK